MSTRCKVGGLVAYTGPYAEILGHTTTIVRQQNYEGNAAWKVEPPLHADYVDPADGRTCQGDWFLDAHLRPIRDRGGEDEMLRIVGLPVADAQHA